MNEISTLPAYSAEELAAASPQQLIDWLIHHEDRVPRSLIDECVRRGEAIVALLRTLYDEDDDERSDDSDGRWWLKLHAIHTLGLMPGEEAGLLMVEHMRRMEASSDESPQDWLAGLWPMLFRNKPVSVLPALRALAGDSSLEWHIRHEAMDSVVVRARDIGEQALVEALVWTASFAADRSENGDLRMFSGNILMDYPRPQFRHLLEDLAREQKKPFIFYSLEDIEEAYAETGDHPSFEKHRTNPWQFYEPAAIKARQERWAKEEVTARESENKWVREGEQLEDIAQPFIRPKTKIGRNDPCPCGSRQK